MFRMLIGLDEDINPIGHGHKGSFCKTFDSAHYIEKYL